MNITTVGIDLAKTVFSLHGVDALGQVVLRCTVRRSQLMERIAKLPPCLIGMETGSGGHQWARDFQALGHEVKLMPLRFVTPYRHGGKNDGNDAEAICEAVRRPNMRFVPMKSLEQQAVLCLHRVHKGFVEERTASLNRIRRLLAEFGFVVARRSNTVRRAVPALLDQLPVHTARRLRDLLDHVRLLDERIQEYGRQVVAWLGMVPK
jgi:transposase